MVLAVFCCVFVKAQTTPVLKTLVRPMVKIEGPEHPPIVNKSGCNATCPTGMSCDGDCCMYPTDETIGQLNYIIYNKCDAIRDLHFQFKVTKEFTAEYDELTNNCNASQITKKLNTTDGIVVQFNCFSKDAPNAMIQYLFYIQGTTIYPHIQYSRGTPDKIDHDWTASTYPITLTKSNSLAKGFVLDVELSSNENGYVNGAKFTVTEPDGKKYVANAPQSSLFPIRISEFQTNIVSTDGHYVHFAEGSEGILSYWAQDALCVEGGNYEHCAATFGDYDIGTCETSSANYGKLSSCCTKPGDSFKQSVTAK